MSRKLIYIPFWDHELREIIESLQNLNDSKYGDLIDRLRILLSEIPND